MKTNELRMDKRAFADSVNCDIFSTEMGRLEGFAKIPYYDDVFCFREFTL